MLRSPRGPPRLRRLFSGMRAQGSVALAAAWRHKRLRLAAPAVLPRTLCSVHEPRLRFRAVRRVELVASFTLFAVAIYFPSGPTGPRGSEIARAPLLLVHRAYAMPPLQQKAAADVAVGSRLTQRPVSTRIWALSPAAIADVPVQQPYPGARTGAVERLSAVNRGCPRCRLS